MPHGSASRLIDRDMYFEVASLEGFFCASLNLLNENPLTSISSGFGETPSNQQGSTISQAVGCDKINHSVQRTKKVQIDERTTTRLRPLHRDHDQI